MPDTPPLGEHEFVLLSGAWSHACELVGALAARRWGIVLAPHDDVAGLCERYRPSVVVSVVRSRHDIPRVAPHTVDDRVSWIVWHLPDGEPDVSPSEPDGATLLPPGTPPAAVVAAVDAALRVLAGQRESSTPQRRYQPGETIQVGHDRMAEVRAGAVAVVGMDARGNELISGFLGPGRSLSLSHHDRIAGTAFVAATAATTRSCSVGEITDLTGCIRRLIDDLAWLRSWAAARGLPGLDERVIHVLGLLGAEFGSRRADSLVVDLRITHQQLAATVGASRSAVTRAVRQLMQRRRLELVGRGAQARFQLPAATAGEFLPLVRDTARAG